MHITFTGLSALFTRVRKLPSLTVRHFIKPLSLMNLQMKEAKVLLLVSFTCANDIVGKKKHKNMLNLKYLLIVGPLFIN